MVTVIRAIWWPWGEGLMRMSKATLQYLPLTSLPFPSSEYGT